MSHTYALDTNALIYYIGGEEQTILRLQPILTSGTIIVPSIVVTEFWSGKTLTEEEIEKVERSLATVFVVPLDATIAKSAGVLRRHYKLDIGDSVIAATALAMNAAVVTRNVDDFKKVPPLLIEAI